MTIQNSDSRISKALADFNKVSRIKVKDEKIFQQLLSVNPKLAKWYSDWSFRYSAFKTMPPSFEKAGITPEKWADIQSKLPKYNEITAKSAEELRLAAEEFDRKRELIERKQAEALKEVETPEVLILKVSLICLPFEDQLRIFSKQGDEREALEKELLENLRFKLLKDLKDNKFENPFKFEDYKDLLLI